MLINIGTRGSKLALWQAYHIEEKLKNAGALTAVHVIHTKGDKILDKSLAKIGSKGVFTEELETQLQDGTIDIAVHSAKDLQSSLGDGLEIIAFDQREKTNDVLISDKELNLDQAITIGTSSTRRVAMLKAFHPHIKIVDMRGNLQTRISKMNKGDCDALLLAYAGVHRMNYHHLIQVELDPNQYTPPVGQGSVAVEASNNLSKQKKELIRKAINHIETEQCLKTERAFLKAINGGCSIPVFGQAKQLKSGVLELEAGIISLDGEKIIRIKLQGKQPDDLGKLLAEKLMIDGGKEILANIRKELDQE